MMDQYGRKIDYMRIAVTDRCNLRCRYCMPEEGIEQLGCKDILSYEEILRLCRLFVQLGITKIKLTGGEPLVRLGFCNLVREIKHLDGIEQVTITTNGVLLEKMAESLIAAGVNGINVSLDTLQENAFAEITRRNQLASVLAGINQLLLLNYTNIKINCVVMEEINGDQILALAQMAKTEAIAVRFIELMPIGFGTKYTSIPSDELMKRLQAAYGKLVPCKTKIGNGPARYFTLPGFKGKIGFIAAMQHKFCQECNRVRLTANGFLKLCLQYNNGIDLKSILRSNVSDEVLKKVIEKSIYQKPQEHHFSEDDPDGAQDGRRMFQIGG